MFKKIINYLKENSFETIYFNIGISIILISIISIISLNIHYPFLWFDEAVQFWISNGIKPDAQAFTKIGSLYDAIYLNKYFNLDPGGFTIIIRYWSKINTNQSFLRLLPFLFYIAAHSLIIYILYLKNKNIFVSTLFSFVIFLFPNLYETAFELRAYSMELLGIVIIILAIEVCNKDSKHKSIFLFSIMSAILMTSRYSTLITVSIGLVVVFTKIYNPNDTIKNRIKLAALIFTPFIIISMGVYFFSYSTQSKFANKLPYLNYLDGNLEFLYTPLNIVMLSLLLTILIVAIKTKKIILIYTCCINVAFIFLSVLGKYPFDLASARCNAITLPIIISMLLIMHKKIGAILNNNWTKISITTILIFILQQNAPVFLPKFDKPIEIYTDLLKLNKKNSHTFFIDRWSNTSIRYMYEYGELKNKQLAHSYPEKFTLMSNNEPYELKSDAKKWYNSQQKMNELLEFEYLITPELAHYTSIETQKDWKAINLEKSIYTKETK